MRTPVNFHRHSLWLGLCLAALVVLSACGKPGPPPPPTAINSLRLVPEAEWPLLLDDRDAKSFFAAAESSLGYLRRVKPDKRFSFGPYQMTAAQMAAMLEELKDLLYTQPDPVKRGEFLRGKYALLEAIGRDGEGEVLMTGYYEPVLEARKVAQESFAYPIYALPEDLVWIDLGLFSPDLPKKRLVGQVAGHKVRPYPDREAIDFKQALAGKAETLGYVADPVEVFFFAHPGLGAAGVRRRLPPAGGLRGQ